MKCLATGRRALIAMAVALVMPLALSGCSVRTEIGDCFGDMDYVHGSSRQGGKMSVHVAATCYKPDTVYADIKIEKKVGSSWVAQPTTVNPTKAYLSAGGARTFVGATPCASGDFRATARLATNKSNGVWSTAKTTTKYTHNPCAAGPSDYRDY